MVQAMAGRVLATRWFAGFATALVLIAGIASAAVWFRGAGPESATGGGPAMAIRMQLPDPGNPRAGGAWIQLESFQWGVAQGGAAERGRVSVSEVVVTKVADASSARLLDACCSPEDAFDEVTIQMCRSSCDTGQAYMEFRLKRAYITSYSVGGSSSGSNLPKGVDLPQLRGDGMEVHDAGSAQDRRRGVPRLRPEELHEGVRNRRRDCGS